MTSKEPFPAEGGCGCRAIRYRLQTAPLFVHCCHCRWCQRESGAAFALNAMIEANRVINLGVAPEIVDTPSDSGLGQKIALPPDVHIFTAPEQPWVVLPAVTPAFAEYYEREALWPAESLARRQAVLPLVEAHQASLQA